MVEYERGRVNFGYIPGSWLALGQALGLRWSMVSSGLMFASPFVLLMYSTGYRGGQVRSTFT